jgi:hypothetical protein
MSEADLITRREAIRRVSALLGGAALVGGDALLTGCRGGARAGAAAFAADEIAFLDEVAETILPQTATPGAKAVQTGAFMALMVQDSYGARDQAIFREGMRKIDDATRAAHGVVFLKATPEQRLAVLQAIDREQKAYSDARAEEKRARSLAYLSDQPREATAVTEDPPPHYFRMMKELALLGYFTSEVGCTQAQRYIESPGRFDPCVPYAPGEKAWAPHA